MTAAIDAPDSPGAAPEMQPGDVLVNYDDVFAAVHGKYFETISVAYQEIGELRAALKQAGGRMRDAEARATALQSVVDDLTAENVDLRARPAPG
jgi:hypothetical protein